MSAPKERRGWYAMIGQLGAPLGFVLAASLFAYLYGSLTTEEFLAWGWRYPFFVAFAVNVVALFARLRLVVGQSYTELLQERELQPVPVHRVVRDEGSNVLLGAFAALASFALFHLVTVFPLSWITLYSEQPVTQILGVQIVGAFPRRAPSWCRAGCRPPGPPQAAGRHGSADRRVQLHGAGAAEHGVKWAAPCSCCWALCCWACRTGRLGARSRPLSPRYRYTLTRPCRRPGLDHWRGICTLVALYLSAQFGLLAVTVYLLSGVACTLGALNLNRRMERRDR